MNSIALVASVSITSGCIRSCSKMAHNMEKEMISTPSRMARAERLYPRVGTASRITRSAIPVMAHRKVGVRAIPIEAIKDTSRGGESTETDHS